MENEGRVVWATRCGLTSLVGQEELQDVGRLLCEWLSHLVELAGEVLPHDVDDEVVLHAAPGEDVESLQMAVHGLGG